MVITPYIAQQKKYKLKKCITIANVQGLAYKSTLIDLVKPVSTGFIDNQKAIVALSRFKEKFTIAYNVPIPFQWFPGYVFDPSIDMKDDYALFVESHKGSPQLTDVKYIDSNGDFVLKWAYFVGVIEYIVRKNFDPENTVMVRGDSVGHYRYALRI